MESLEELKAIIAGKPEGATHLDVDGDYVKFIDDGMYYYTFASGRGWCNDYFAACELRSLSDIKRLIELMEIVEDAAALGFLTPSFDSGVSHKQLCKKYEALK